MRGTLAAAIESAKSVQSERVLEIVYRPQALFRVRAVSRCSSSMSGEVEKAHNNNLLLYQCLSRSYGVCYQC